MKKKILGITALLAVLAMCLTFTACPPDNELRSVDFVNELGITVALSFEGQSGITLAAVTKTSTPPDSKKTVERTGKDIVLTGITFGDPNVDRDPTQYVMLEGNLLPGNQKRGKDAIGVALSGGTLYFRIVPDMPSNANPASPKKVDVIQLDD